MEQPATLRELQEERDKTARKLAGYKDMEQRATVATDRLVQEKAEPDKVQQAQKNLEMLKERRAALETRHREQGQKVKDKEKELILLHRKGGGGGEGNMRQRAMAPPPRNGQGEKAAAPDPAGKTDLDRAALERQKQAQLELARKHEMTRD